MENTADVEYYTTYPKKTGKDRKLPVVHGHTLPPLRSLPIAMVLVLLYYYYSKKKARQTEKKVRKKSTGRKVREKKYKGKTGHAQNILQKKSTWNRKKGVEKRAGNPVAHAHIRWNPSGVTSLMVAHAHAITFGRSTSWIHLHKYDLNCMDPPPQLMFVRYHILLLRLLPLQHMHGDQGWWQKYINNTIIARRNAIYNVFGEVNSTDNMTSDEFLLYLMKWPVFVHSTFTYVFYRIKPRDTEGLRKSKSSVYSTDSSTYCVFSISQGSKWSSSSEGYASFTVSIIFLVILKAFHYITLEHYIGSF